MAKVLEWGGVENEATKPRGELLLRCSTPAQTSGRIGMLGS